MAEKETSHLTDIVEDSTAISVVVDNPESEQVEVHVIEAGEPGAIAKIEALERKNPGAAVMSFFGQRFLVEKPDTIESKTHYLKTKIAAGAGLLLTGAVVEMIGLEIDNEYMTGGGLAAALAGALVVASQAKNIPESWARKLKYDGG